MGSSFSQSANLFRDFTQSEKYKSPSPLLNLVSDQQVYEYSPDRSKFYTQLWESLTSADPSVVDKVIGLEMRNRKDFDSIQKSTMDVTKSMRNLERIADEKYNAKGGTWYSDRLTELKKADAESDNIGKKRIFDNYQNSPVFSPEVEKVSATDRVVFIAFTFVLRAITLYLVEWAINNRMVLTFEKAFIFYFSIYIAFVILWAMLVNLNKDELMFKMIFYYINFDTSKGVTRLVAHCAIQMLLLPIPFILREQPSASAYLTFQERRNMIDTLSKFTMFLWILTSVIAMRV